MKYYDSKEFTYDKNSKDLAIEVYGVHKIDDFIKLLNDFKENECAEYIYFNASGDYTAEVVSYIEIWKQVKLDKK